MDDRAGIALPIFALVSVVTLLALLLGFRSRANLPVRLIGLGTWLALVALWYGLLTSLPTRDHNLMPYGNPALAEVMLKLAAVLVLGGIVAGLLTRDAGSVPPALPERPRDVPPSV